MTRSKRPVADRLRRSRIGPSCDGRRPATGARLPGGGQPAACRRSTTRTALPSLRGMLPGRDQRHGDPQAGVIPQELLEPGLRAGRDPGGASGLALEGQLVQRAGPLDDQAVVRCHAAGAEQHVLHLRGIDVDAAHDQHVVVAAAQPGQPDRGAAALARPDGQAADVAGPVAQQRHGLLGQRGEHELAFGPRRDGRPPPGSITSTAKWSSWTCSPARAWHSAATPGPHISDRP